MKSMRQVSILTVSSLSLLFVGCSGGGGLPEGVTTGNVKGTILYNGNPVPENCIVTFLPEGGTGIPAAGDIAADGSFTLRAKGTLDIPTGVYKVTVLPPPPPQLSAEESMLASNAGTLPSTDVKEVPLKYRAQDTTPEVFEVKEGSNTYELDMKD